MSNSRSQPKRERILDVAEELFALHGYDGVTLRQIAKGAGVDVALASYHFGKKLDLFNAVFERRAELLNSARLDALRACQQSATSRGPSVEQIIEAFLRPLELAQETGDPGWQHYLALIAYINNSPYWGPRMMSKLFDELVSEFIAALRKALPVLVLPQPVRRADPDPGADRSHRQAVRRQVSFRRFRGRLQSHDPVCCRGLQAGLRQECAEIVSLSRARGLSRSGSPALSAAAFQTG